jgi:hypothetical protein
VAAVVVGQTEPELLAQVVTAVVEPVVMPRVERLEHLTRAVAVVPVVELSQMPEQMVVTVALELLFYDTQTREQSPSVQD